MPARSRSSEVKAAAAVAVDKIGPPGTIEEHKEEIPSLVELKKSIPAELFQPSLAWSVAYVLRDFALTAALLYGIVSCESSSTLWWCLWPLYAFAQGTTMWAIFVLGHDCGHGSFSRSATINSIFGHILHSSILVPFHAWRITHRSHHKNTGNMDKDEIFFPMRSWRLEKSPLIGQFLQTVDSGVFVLAWPLYLVFGYKMKGRPTSHFWPWATYFTPKETPLVIKSIISWAVVAAGLLYLGSMYGYWRLFAYYTVPYLIFSGWLVVVTFLHHHEEGIPWYSTDNWDYVKGNLSSIDRSYGYVIEHWHHNIGTHVVHHLFPLIPHYNLCKANLHLRKVLKGKHRSNTERIIPAFFQGWRRYMSNLIVSETAQEHRMIN